MIQKLGAWLAHPGLRAAPLGSAAWFRAQAQMIEEKPLVGACYALWCARMQEDERSVRHAGAVVELGGGSSQLRKRWPGILVSDVVAGPEVNLVADGRRLPFRDGSVRALLLMHVFHHIPDVSLFLKEAARVLVPGGVISMVDCAHTPFSRFFFGRIHPEPYRAEAREWSFPEGHTMLDSNQALTWIVFERDRARFEAENPGLRIEGRRWLPWFSYLLSGGVNLRSFVPRGCEGLVTLADRMLRPLDRWCAIHWHWTIRKDDGLR